MKVFLLIYFYLLLIVFFYSIVSSVIELLKTSCQCIQRVIVFSSSYPSVRFSACVWILLSFCWQ